jgi:hypothetical protein
MRRQVFVPPRLSHSAYIWSPKIVRHLLPGNKANDARRITIELKHPVSSLTLYYVVGWMIALRETGRGGRAVDRRHRGQAGDRVTFSCRFSAGTNTGRSATITLIRVGPLPPGRAT